VLDTKLHSTCTLVWDWYIIIISSVDDDDYVLYYGYDLWVRYMWYQSASYDTRPYGVYTRIYEN